MEPYYDDGTCVIYHGDCRELLGSLEADAVVTDPPYGVDKAAWDGSLPMDLLELASFRCSSLAVMPGVVNLGVMPQHLGAQVYRWTLSAYLSNGMTRGAIGFANWIPCVLYSKDGVSVYRQDGDAKSFVVGVDDKPDHPSPKPLRVMSWVLARTPPGSVLDPFMGSGTTLLAAKMHGRKAIGIELDERYCEIAAKRLAQGALDFGVA